jgi:dissimilatory sulfite reductase related protein
MEKTIAGRRIEVNEEGYLKDQTQWDKEICQELAKEENIALSPRHWDVISYLRDENQKGIPLSIRKVGNSGKISIKEFYELFPNGPLKTSSKIAGIPKPASCI